MRNLWYTVTHLLLFCAGSCFGQDYIVTWKNDTVFCELPSNPAKADFRPRGDHKNGYFRLAAIFPNDSVRVINPGEIKGYYRSRHGKSLLCDGVFHSIKTNEATRFVTDADGKMHNYKWYFMAVDQPGKHASLYKVLVYNKRLETWYYVVKHNTENDSEGLAITTRKRIAEYLAEKHIETALREFIKKSKSYRKIVVEYNRLKDEAMNK